MTTAEKSFPAIIEQYISQHALPNETISSWIKWELEPAGIFDNIVLRTEADIALRGMLNISEEANLKLGTEDPYRGLFIVDRRDLEVDGFFGFHCQYTRIPDSTREISFRVAFVGEGANIREIELTTRIIVPQVTLKHISDREIILTENRQTIDLTMEVERSGPAYIRGFRLFVDFTRGGGNLKATMVPDPEIESGQRLSIKGTGFALIRIGLEFYDGIGNHYKLYPAEILIDKRLQAPASIPVNSQVLGMEPLLTVK